LNLQALQIRLVRPEEEQRYQALMQAHHYLGSLAKIGENLWYVATILGEWVALLGFSSAALKCAVRDRWIGWNFRHQYFRLNLLTNNSRFLILPEWHYPNLASKTLSLCLKRLSGDWQKHFGHPLLLVETFVDPARFQGTLYKAANWLYLGDTQGFSRTRQGYSATATAPKMLFVFLLQADARVVLSRPLLESPYQTGTPKLMLSAEKMHSLYDFFTAIPDPRRAQGRRHSLPTVLAISAAAVLCGMQGYKAIWDWAKALGPKGRERFRCRYVKGSFLIPSESIFRDVLIRVNPEQLDLALQQWHEAHGQEDESLAIDGKTMKNAIDKEGRQTHIMSAVGHQTKACYTQKKSVLCP
jgi:Domain of unknown function (DUF4338)/DDE_Tnp_1-associated